MEPIPGDPIIREIRRLATSEGICQISDAELLARFVAKNDQSAFAALVERLGPMVLRLCRRLLPDTHAADDAFQATFLILVRKAGAIRNPDLLSNWLYGVALRVARQAQADAACRRKHEGRVGTRCTGDPGTDASWSELCAVLDEELQRLPDKYRAAFLLCYVEGKTRDQVARQLGWPLRTLDRQLERGRSLLQVRLTRRGITLAGALLSIHAASEVSGAVGPALKEAVISTAMSLVKSGDLAALSGPGAELARHVLRGMTMFKKVALLSCVLTFACMAAAFGYFGNGHDEMPLAQDVRKPPLDQAKPVANDMGKDPLGDSLPADALLRLGTLRFRYDSVVRRLAFARDGKTLLCAGWDKAIRRWNAQSGAELEPLIGPEKGLLDAAVSADGKILVGGTADGNIHVWDLITGKELKKVAVPGGKVIRHVTLAPDGRSVAVAGDDNAVRVFDWSADGPFREIVKYKQQPTGVAFSVDGKRLASASYDGTAHVHDAVTGKEMFQPRAKNGSILSVCFAPDGKTLLAGEQNAISIWDASSGQMQKRVEGVGGEVFVLMFAPDGRTFAGGTSKGMIHIWESSSTKQLQKIKGHADNVQALAFAPDGGTLASGGSERAVRLWDTNTGKQINTLVGHQERVTAVAVAPGGKLIATAAWDHSVRIWDADAGKEQRRFGWPAKENLPIGTSEGVSALVFSPDGKLLAAAGYENKVWLWDLEKEKFVHEFPGICADFSPDGKHLVTAGWTPIARLYETATGKEVRQFQGHLSGIFDLRFTPDGKNLVTASVGAPYGFRTGGEKWDKQTIWLWDVATAKVRRQFGSEYRPGGLAVSPDGRMVSASAGLLDKVLHVWELASGKERAVLPGHGEMIFASAFAPDGRSLASGSMDNTVRLWQLPSCKPGHTLEGHRGWVLNLAFFPDGKKLVSSSLDTTGLVWKMPAMTPPQAKVLPADLAKPWEDLASADAKIAFQAIAALAAGGEQAVSFLTEKLKPTPAPDPELVAQLIADLDSKDFVARQTATAELEKRAELVVPAMRAALDKRPPLEVARRIEKILESVVSRAPAGETLREIRAVEALEFIATPKARALLVTLGQGAPGAYLTRDSQAATRRLDKRAARTP